MTKRTIMYLYKMKSAGGLALKEEMKLQQIAHENSRFTGDKDTTIINWGSGNRFTGEKAKCKIINDPEAVYNAINKVKFLQNASQITRCVPYTTSRWLAQTWLALGDTIYCRLHAEGAEGSGIEIVKQGRLPAAPLFTKAIPSTREYRVHVVDGKAIVVHRKVADEGPDDKLKQDVRNTANGWVFRRVTEYPRDVVDQAVPAVKACGLDFAAVDVLYDGAKAWVLEANTAPGIDEMEYTVSQYSKHLKALAESR